MIILLGVIVTTLLAKASGVVELSDFFQFGPTFDTHLHHNDDDYSPPINVTVTFPFFTKQHSTLFVHTNGILSFYKGIVKSHSKSFRDIEQGVIVLAPFWTDIDTQNCKSDCDIWYRESVRPEDLNKATSTVRQFFPFMEHFDATWTFVVTWYQVPQYNSTGKGYQQRNTFQAVILTNTDSAFVIYYYNKIEWTGKPPAQVGFNKGDKNTCYSVEGSRTNMVLQLPNLSNVDSPGTFAFRIDLKNQDPQPLPGVWFPVFVAFSGNGQSVYASWNDRFECNTVHGKNNISRTRHLRNPILDKWTSFNIQKVKLELYDENCLKMWMRFNGKYTTVTNWFSRRNFIASSLIGLEKQDIEELRIDNTTQLPFVIRSVTRQLWFFVYEDLSHVYKGKDNDAVGNIVPDDQPGPHFMYVKYKPNQELEYGSGEKLIISILLEDE